MIDALKTRFGIPESDIVYLAETPSRDAARIKGPATKESVERELAALGERSKSRRRAVRDADRSWERRGRCAHGSTSRGPTSPRRISRACSTRVHGPVVAIVNASSASGGFIGALSGPNRVDCDGDEVGHGAESDAVRRRTSCRRTRATSPMPTRTAACRCSRRSSTRGAKSRGRTRRKIICSPSMRSSTTTATRRGRRRPTRSPPTARSLDASSLAEPPGAWRRWRARRRRATRSVATLEREKDALETRIDSLRRQKATMDSTAYEKALEDVAGAACREEQGDSRGGGRKAMMRAASMLRARAPGRNARERVVRERPAGVGVAGRAGRSESQLRRAGELERTGKYDEAIDL